MKDYPHKIIETLQLKKTKKFAILESISYKVYEVDINFDNAHEEWCKNKIKGKNGTYKYK